MPTPCFATSSPPSTDPLLAFLTCFSASRRPTAPSRPGTGSSSCIRNLNCAICSTTSATWFTRAVPTQPSPPGNRPPPCSTSPAYLPTADNLIVNGDFSLDILNGGFDWTYDMQNGVHLLLDPSDFREGQRSLSITFEGPGISDAGIQQLIPVHGDTAYDFTAYYKSSEFQGAGGPEIVLRDAYTRQPMFTSDPLNDADFWKPVQLISPRPLRPHCSS